MIDLNSARNAEAEYGVIGAILLDQSVIPKIAAKLSGDDFSIGPCGKLYEAAVDATERGKVFEPIVAIDILKKEMGDKAGEFVSEILNLTPTAANVEAYAEIVHRYSGLRQIRESVERTLLNGEDPKAIASDLIVMSQTFLQRNKTSNRVSMADVLTETYSDLQKAETRTVKTGFPAFDAMLNGAEPGELILVAARPGVGKTAFGMEWALSSAAKGYGTDFYSLEMQRVQLAKRMMSRKTSVSMDSLFKRTLNHEDWQDINRASSRLSEYPLCIFDDPYTTVSKIRANSITTKNLGLIVIDYIQLLMNDRRYEKRSEAVGENSRALKRLAKELNVPIVALAQLNRTVEDNDRPNLGSLKESGDLEQDADKVMFLWKLDEPTGGVIRVGNYIAKNRNGPLGTLVFRFDGSHMTFTETQEKYTPKKKTRLNLEDDA